jgi:rod shape-determining protein MreC
VRAEKRVLKDQIEQMRIEQVRLSEDAAQARRLQTLLAFKEQFISKTVAAQVIGSSGSDLSRIIYIDKGADAGLRRDMAVITADGIVGKLMLVYPSVSQVLLINDQSSGVGAILEKSRLQGVLRGTPTGEVLLERVMSDEQVPVGETVLTSGGDQIFPKGLPVGTVAKVANGKDLFLNIKVKPAASLSRLEEVLVLVEKQEKQAVAEDTVRVRAADILAQRLPSVPDKPATDANGAAAAATDVAKPNSTPNAGTKPVGTAAATQVPKNSAATGGPRVPAAGAPAGLASVRPSTTAKTAVAPAGNPGIELLPPDSPNKSAEIPPSKPEAPKPEAPKPSQPPTQQTHPPQAEQSSPQ